MTNAAGVAAAVTAHGGAGTAANGGIGVLGAAAVVTSLGGTGTPHNGGPVMNGVNATVSPRVANGEVWYYNVTGNLTLTPPFGFSAGDLLVMAVIASGPGSAYPAAPAGWNAITPAGSTFGVWWKNAAATEPNVSFSLGSTYYLAGFIADYLFLAGNKIPTVLSSAASSVAGSAGNVSFTGSMPAAYGSTNVLIAAGQGWGLSGTQNTETQGDILLSLPWNPEVDPYTTLVLPQDNLGAPVTTYNVGLGLSDFPGVPAATPTVSSVQDLSFWTAVLGLVGSIGGAGAASTGAGGAGTASGGANANGAAASAAAQGWAGTPFGVSTVLGAGGAVTAQGGAGIPSAGITTAGVAAVATAQGGAGAPSGGAGGVAAPITAQSGAGTPSGLASITGAAAAAAALGGLGAAYGAASISGATAPVPATAGAGISSGQALVPGTAAAAAILGGTGTPASSAAATGTTAAVTAQGGAGTQYGNTSVSVPGTVAVVTVQGGAGTLTAGTNPAGVAATAAAQGDAGTPAGDASAHGAAASVTAAGGAGSLSMGACTGVAALAATAAGTGTATGTGLATVTITGTFPTVTGGGQDGYATFDPGTTLRDATDHVILGGAATTQIRGAAMIPITLPATDNTHLTPGPGEWAYTVRVHLGAQTLTWTVALPASLAPSVDLSALLDI